MNFLSNHFQRCCSWTAKSLLLFAVFIAWQPTVEGAKYEDVVKAAAETFASYAGRNGEKDITVRPQFRGLPSMPSGAGAGFTELLKVYLAPRGIQIGSRAKYSLEARLELTEKKQSARMIASVYDQNGRRVKEIDSLPLIDDPKDLAEVLGIPIHFGPVSNQESRRKKFPERFNSKQIFAGSSSDGTRRGVLYSDRSGKYGIGLRVDNKVRPFENREGLAYTKLDFGEQYSLFLTNSTDEEVVVNVKIDGVNVFHFSDKDARRPDGSKYKYWIVPPKSTMNVRGWYKNSSRQLRFAITPVTEGAAAKAGIPLENVGMVTATFHASWVGDARPTSEPPIIRKYTISRSVPRVVSREIKVKLPDGSFQTKTVYETRTKSVQEERTATGFGEEIMVNTKGANRTIGISRATVAFRYERSKD